ncbi:cyclin-like protein [Plasmopara halstedii]|uniref:Cyclin-like protein n=1 Tax=Plasmopara halstedii TaxID=4781 RepID=A0A0P1ARU8_PLAHL|nr:cyclin-like protein [Plasmopara halstedii]CEG44354.1 cyclin-like protein [Plasmopara halstedii]|eukprot:XP_024580723.1 cyclin-like protein [Plasmopara halstedii]
MLEHLLNSISVIKSAVVSCTNRALLELVEIRFSSIQPEAPSYLIIIYNLHTAMTASSNDWIFSEKELRATPSQRDGMKHTDELVLRRKACDLIEKMAKALELPKLAQISAANFLHRFYMRQSLVRYDKFLVAAACVLLGSKAEESPKKIGLVAKIYIAVRKVVEKDQVFAIQKHDSQAIGGKIISMEGVVLHSLAYELTLSHPYKYINEKVDKVVRLQQLNEEETKIQSSKIKQVAWSFLNDSAYTVACLRLESVDLAAGAVYLAGLYESYVPEDLCTESGLPWWSALATPLHTLQDAARYLLNAYTAPYIKTNVLAAGLSKLVYMFHPPKSVEASASLVEVDIVEELPSPIVSSPMDSAACVTSPECCSSQGRSPYDHDFDQDVKVHVMDSDESPRETAQIPATPASLLDSFPLANESSSADKLLGSTATTRVANNGRLSFKRSKDPEKTFFSEKKLKHCM